jgi:hypothetical protein
MDQATVPLKLTASVSKFLLERRMPTESVHATPALVCKLDQYVQCGRLFWSRTSLVHASSVMHDIDSIRFIRK